MLYPKKNAKNLDPALFQKPTAEYRAAPFWAWNTKLQKDELLWQIEMLKQMGFGGFHMHARSGLATEYLGDEFMQMVRSCVEKAKDEDMLAYLYDEDRWPSGFAGGLVTRDKKYRIRYLLMTVNPYSADEDHYVAPNERNVAKRGGDNSSLLARYSITLDEQGYLTAYKRLADGEEASGKLWYAYIESPNESPRYNRTTYVNTFSKEAIDRFIEITHERYKEKVGDEFGGVIPSIFTDEPQHTFKMTAAYAKSEDDILLPFTDDLEDSFTAATGISLLDHLPELFFELPDGNISRVRYLYHDHLAERFVSAFSDNIGKWCEKNGIALTGHVMREPTLTTQTGSVGECMRHYRSFTIPGIDMLSNRHEYNTAKQAQSAVNQYGREGMMDELYGVTTWDFDFRGHKLYGDWQAALGVTLRVPHLAWLSMEGEAKRDYPASISYQSPWYREYSYIEDHFARVNTAMTRGKPVVKVGVIHPIESFWLHWGPADQTATIRETMDKNFADVTEWLLSGSIDFDFICESTLPAQCESGTAPLPVGKMRYDAVVVPACETLRSTTLARLEAFRAAGGKLIFMGDAPRYADAIPSERGKELFGQSLQIPFARRALLEALESERTVELRDATGALCQDYFYRMREDNGKRWLFIARSRDAYNIDIASVDNLSIKVIGQYAPTLYNTLTGEISPMRYRFENGNTVIPAALYQHDSLLMLLTPTTEECSITADPIKLIDIPGTRTNSSLSSLEAQIAAKRAKKETKKVDSIALSLPHAVPFTLDEPNALLLDMATWRLNGGEWQDEEEILRIDTAVRTLNGWNPNGNACDQPWYLPKKRGGDTVELQFAFESEIDFTGALLAIEKPQIATVKLNGVALDTTSLGWYVDKSIKKIALPPIKKGTNVIEITYPYGEGDSLERIYVLGDFGVRVEGSHAVMTALPRTIAFGDIVPQGFPFYSGKLTYHFETETKEGTLRVRTPQYRAALLRATVDGKDSKVIAFSPYYADFSVTDGKHTVDIDAYINRTNGFGTLHCADEKHSYQSPGVWRTKGDEWCYEYRLTREGILVSPQFTLLK